MPQQIEKLFGPPGTGKTSALLDILQRELQGGVPLDRIAFVSFTRAARQVAVERVGTVLGATQAELPYFRTLHSIAYRALGLTAQAVLRSPSESAELSAMLSVPFSPPPVTRVDDDIDDIPPVGGELGDRLLAFDHFRRHNLLSVEDAYKQWSDDDTNAYIVKHFCDTYARFKEDEGLHDFTDMLQLVNVALPIDVLIVDEAQDLSRLQWAALDRLARHAVRVYIAGDDDQAIFTWAGASPETFLARPGVGRVLGQSHRVPRLIQPVAEKLIHGVKVRQHKEWRHRPADGILRYCYDTDAVAFDAPGSYLVLFRHHYLGRAIEQRLREDGEPYSRADRQAPGLTWGPAIISWERLRKGQVCYLPEVAAVYDAMTAGVSISRHARNTLKGLTNDTSFTLDTLTAKHGLTTSAPWYDALTKIGRADAQYMRALIKRHGAKGLLGKPRITLSTIHAAKGAEAEHVTLLTELSRRTYNSLDIDPDPERRVFYVGVTRARESLTIVGDNNPLF